MKKVVGIWLVMMVFLTSSLAVFAKSIEISEKERTFLALRMSWKTQVPDEQGLYAHHMINIEKNENFPEMSVLTIVTEFYDAEDSYRGTREFSGQIPEGIIDFDSRIGTYLHVSMQVEGLETFYPQYRKSFLQEDIFPIIAESGQEFHTLSLEIRIIPGNPDIGSVDEGTPGGIYGSYHNHKNHSVRISGMLDTVAMVNQVGTLVLTDVPASPPGMIEYMKLIIR